MGGPWDSSRTPTPVHSELQGERCRLTAPEELRVAAPHDLQAELASDDVPDRRRALSLLPDYHLCVVFERQLFETVAEALEKASVEIRDQGRPLTLVSGPSATSDIELIRVEGVHGPRTLEVILVVEAD